MSLCVSRIKRKLSLIEFVLYIVGSLEKNVKKRVDVLPLFEGGWGDFTSRDFQNEKSNNKIFKII